MTIAIKKIRNSKYSNPEAYNAMIIEDRNKREKTVKLEDLPVWLIVLLGAACVVGIMGELGAFNSYPLVSFPLSILLIAFLIYYFLYKRKIAKEKYGAS
jgi:ABC-type xylose transport system permease subunit